MYLREEKCLNFVFLLLVSVSKKAKGELGKKILCDLPRHSSVMAEIILSIPLFLSAHLHDKLFSSADEQTQIQVGNNILSHLKETVKISLSHLVFVV